MKRADFEAENEAESSRRSPEGLVIRGWQAADAEGMAELANQPNYRFGTLRQPFETPDFWRRRIETAADTLGLVAVLDGAVIGSLGLQRLAGRRAHTGILGMGVHDAFQGRGIGTALVTAAVETADRWLGLKRLQLTVYADNAAAIALYRKFGFEVEGLHRVFALRDGAYVDALAMARLV